MCNAHAPHHELTMIGATLQSLARTGKLHVSTAAECCGKDESTIYRWISGESEPPASAIQLLIAHYPDEEAQLAIAAAQMRGSPFFVRRMPTDLDVNGDGQIDLTDALEKCGGATGVISQMTIALAKQLREGKHRISEEEVQAFTRECERALLSVCGIEQIVQAAHEMQSRRRKARPVNGGVA